MKDVVFYQKMMGDYNRYLSEFEQDENIKNDFIQKADHAYKIAFDKAKLSLNSTI